MGGSSLRSMPSSPAASITAKARYGLQLGSGQRSSQRVLRVRPGVMRGMRISALRLVRPQEM
jgi:hypothetical protein